MTSNNNNTKMFQPAKQKAKLFSKFNTAKVSDISDEPQQTDEIYRNINQRNFKNESDSESKRSKSSKSTELTAVSSFDSDDQHRQDIKIDNMDKKDNLPTEGHDSITRVIQPATKHPSSQKFLWKKLVKKHKKAILEMLKESDENVSMQIDADRDFKPSDYRSGSDASDFNRQNENFSRQQESRFGKKNDQDILDRRMMLDADLSRSGDTYIRSAIPYLPKNAAVVCLIMNLIIPGSGTIFSGVLVIFCGQPRMGSKDGTYASTLCVNMAVGSMQLITVPLFFVGWIWSLVWGIYIILLAEEKRMMEKEQHENHLKAKALSAFDPKFRIWAGQQSLV